MHFFANSSDQELTGYIAGLADSQLTGSTQYDAIHAYHLSRLHTVAANGYTGTWASGSLSIGQFIQADLGTVRRVKKVATQGRASAYNSYVASYKFAYSADGLMYLFIAGCDGNDRVFSGNIDRDTVVENTLKTAVAARYVRVYPLVWQQHMSLRWEVYGCDIGKTHPQF